MLMRNPRQDVAAGVITPGIKMTPDASPHPLAGQRVIRGIGVLLVMVLFAVNIGLAITLWTMHRGRTVRVVPEAETVSVGGRLERIDNNKLKAFALRFCVDAGNYAPATVDDMMTVLGPRLHPRAADAIEAEWEKRKVEVKGQRLFVTSLVRKAAVLANKDGLYTVVVRVDEITRAAGGDVDESLEDIDIKVAKKQLIELAGRNDRVWVVDMMQADPTEDNPEGLQVLRYFPMKESDWIAQTGQVFWTTKVDQ
jgi:hypothetical protein